MKKTIALIMALLMLLSIFPASVLAAELNEPEISIDSAEVTPGETFDVNVTLKNNPGIVSANLKLAFDEGLTLVGATNGDVFSTLTYIPPKALSTGGQITSECRFAWTGFDIADKDIKNGKILTLTFKASENVEPGEELNVSITSESGDVIDRDLKPVVLTADSKIVIEGGAEPEEGVATLRIASATAAPGEKVTLDVSIENNPGIVSANLKLVFDEGLTLIGASNVDAFSTLTYIPPKQLSSGGQITSECRFAWTGFDIEDKDITDGRILSLEFEISEDVAIGEELNVSITSEPGDVIDKNLGMVALSAQSTVEVEDEEGDETLPYIYFSTPTAIPGETVTVDVYIKNNPGIVSANLKLTFSEGLTLIGASNGNAFSTLTYIPPKQLTTGGQITSECRFAWTGFDIADEDIVDGKILSLIFAVSDEAEDGDSFSVKITADDGDVIDKDLGTVGITSQLSIEVVGKEDQGYDSINDFEYELADGGIVITGYAGTKSNVNIGESYEIDGEEYDVVGIAESAFEGEEDIESVTIPKTVESIGEYAFYDCIALVSVTIMGKNTEIGEKALGYYYISRKEDGVVEGFEINGYEGSTAEDYVASDEEMTFIPLEEEECTHEGDTYIKDNADATCTVDGYTGDTYCSGCDEKIADGEVIPAVGYHTYGNWTVNAEDDKKMSRTCTVCGDVEESAVYLAGRSLLFKDIIQMRYYFDFSKFGDDVTETGLLIWTEDEYAEADEHNISTAPYKTTNLAQNSKGYYYGDSAGIPAKNMIDKQVAIAYAVLSDGTIEYTEECVFSPVMYSQIILAEGSTSKATMKTLAASLMNYGAAAQNFFNYKTETPMNAWMSDELKAVGFDTSLIQALPEIDNNKLEGCNDDTVTKRGSSLTFVGNINQNIYFDIKDDVITDAKVLYWTESEYKKLDKLTTANAHTADLVYDAANSASLKINCYRSVFEGVAAKDLRDAFVFAVCYKDAEGNEHYSTLFADGAHDYVRRVVTGSSKQTMKDLAKAFLMYHLAAEDHLLG